MLEIVILIILAGKIGKIVESKGRKKIGYQLMLIGLWLGGEIFGGILGGIIGAIAVGDEDGSMLFGIGFALVFAITGAVIAFQIAKNLTPLDREEDFAGDIEYVERLRAHEHFGERDSADSSPTDAYTNRPEKDRRPLDDRIQE
jgi:hypothetical protein